DRRQALLEGGRRALGGGGSGSLGKNSVLGGHGHHILSRPGRERQPAADTGARQKGSLSGTPTPSRRSPRPRNWARSEAARSNSSWRAASRISPRSVAMRFASAAGSSGASAATLAPFTGTVT